MTGRYADRLARLATEAERGVVPLPVEHVSPEAVEAALAADCGLSHLALVYSGTAIGIVYDVPALTAAAGRLGRRVLVDAVSAFGAMPLDVSAPPTVDAACFAAGKCLERLPGAAFAVVRIA